MPRSLSSPSSSSSRCCPSRCRSPPCASTGTTVKLVGMLQTAPDPLAPPPRAAGRVSRALPPPSRESHFLTQRGGGGRRRATSPSPLAWWRCGRNSEGRGTGPGASPLPQTLAYSYPCSAKTTRLLLFWYHQTETAFQTKPEPGCRTLILQITEGMTVPKRPKQGICDHLLDKWRKFTVCLWTTRT